MRRKWLIGIAVVLAVIVVASVIASQHKKNQTACVNHELALSGFDPSSPAVQAALRAYPNFYSGPGTGPSVNAISFARGACGEQP